MSKLALIIEDVGHCLECPLCSGVRCFVSGTVLTGNEAEAIKNKRRPNWCPLKELPEEEDKK